MPDTKITALTAISTVDPAADPLVIVDVSDTSMAASGTTKKSTINQLLGSGGTATLASAIITGDLTVDTNTLKVDSANNRVGIGTASPSAALDVNGASNLNGNVTIANTGSPFGTLFVTGSALELQANSNATNGLSLKTTSTTPIIFSVNSSEAMRLNSTGLGVGGSPDTGLFTIGGTGITSATTPSMRVLSNKATLVVTADGATNAAGTTINYSWANGGQGPLIFRNAAISNVMTLDASGNCGIGVTPSAKLHVEGNGAQGRFSVASATDARHEYYRNGVIEGLIGWDANAFKMFAFQSGGKLEFYTGGSNLRATIDSSGNVISNVTGTAPTLGTNNQMVFNLTSNTNLRISVRGSDGVTRTANITLA